MGRNASDLDPGKEFLSLRISHNFFFPVAHILLFFTPPDDSVAFFFRKLCSLCLCLPCPHSTVTMDPTMWQYQFRIIMLGDSTVGKTSLLKRYTEDTFLHSINQTVGVDFYVRFLDVEPGVRVKLQFWDTAGQERFR